MPSSPAAEPWSSPAAPPTAPAAPAPPAGGAAGPPRGANAVESAFHEWYSGSAPAGAAPEPAQPQPPEAVAAPSSAEAAVEQDDEDLEMFRSWLQSLKK
ncbi:MAG TPA: hypothetical protein VMN60_12085 [Longimicrobiales bacterium]|nr:hypothetical protein [Longimicrobiales bacterium]